MALHNVEKPIPERRILSNVAIERLKRELREDEWWCAVVGAARVRSVAVKRTCSFVADIHFMSV